MAATTIGSLGLGAGGTAGALVAVEVTGDDAAAGLPLGLLVIGSALGALLIAWVSHRRGRLVGLSVGYGLGVVGAILVVVATEASVFWVVLLGSFLLGAANAAVFMTRYAAAELASLDRRGRALGGVLAATAGGAVAGVFLLGPAGVAATSVGLSGPAGLYVLAIPAFGLAALLLAGLQIRRSGRSARLSATSAGPGPWAAAATALRRPAARTALLTLATGNLAMAAIMVVIPVHLTGHDHQLGAIGRLVAIHAAGMFALSPLTGWVADRVGGHAVGITGLAGLLATAAVWSQVSDASGWAAGLLLLALGVGWNAAVVGGSAILAAGVPGGSRLHAEAAGEVAMGVAAAVGAPLAGVLVAATGFPGLCLAVATACGLSLLACHRSNANRRARAARPDTHAGPEPHELATAVVASAAPARPGDEVDQ